MKQPARLIIAFVLIGFIAMGLVDALWQPNYFIKAAIKLVLFLILPLYFFARTSTVPLREMFTPQKSGLKIAFLLGGAIFVLILGSYFLLGNLFDFSGVTSSLTGDIGVSAENFIYVALYISIINSLLEEFFFRGFAFLTLKKFTTRRFAYFFSAITFALYHVAMMIGWFEWEIFALSLVSLIVAGLLFNWLNEKHGNIYTSWLVHLCANLGINTIGLILFGIL